MKGIIWCTRDSAKENWDKATEILTKIVEDYLRSGHFCIKDKQLSSERVVTFDNGDQWKIVYASEYQRGQKCNISYIQRCISKDIIDNIIRHCTVAPPFQGYKEWI